MAEGISKKLIVGLGNPGVKHAKNRHNIGFMAVDAFAARHELKLDRKKHNAFIGSGMIEGQAVIIAKPRTFMNMSGSSVGKLAKFFNVAVSELIVIYDEIDLPLGTIRIREKGGSGGHNGMRSIISQVGQDFPRIRLGVSRPPGRMEPADYVLSNFKADEWPVVEEMVITTSDAMEMILRDGLERAMTAYNGPLTSQDQGDPAG